MPEDSCAQLLSLSPAFRHNPHYEDRNHWFWKNRGWSRTQRMGSDIALRLMNPAEATELVKSGDVLARTFVAIFAGAGSTDRRRSRFRKLLDLLHR